MTLIADESEVSDEAVEICMWIVLGVLCQIINIFGVVTNIFNIICFSKQGFEDSVSISLIGLSISDLGSLLTMIWTCISFTPAVVSADLPFDPMEVSYLTSVMVHFSFTRVTGCMTAVITLEKCICITAPLKVKSLITPNRVTVITSSVFIIFFCSGAPVYAVNRLDMTFSPLRNKTLVGIISTKNRETVEMISFIISNFSIPLCSFVIIVVCTTIIALKLHIQSKWRQKTITMVQEDRISNRNQKAAKMIVVISTLFIACFVPVSVIVLAMAFLPELSLQGKYMHLSLMIGAFGYVMESINSSMNIFIYANMSSKYRKNLFKLLG